MMQAFNGDMLSNRGEYRGLKIISNENGGRYIYEKELLSPGECILQVNRPRFAIPDWKRRKWFTEEEVKYYLYWVTQRH